MSPSPYEIVANTIRAAGEDGIDPGALVYALTSPEAQPRLTREAVRSALLTLTSSNKVIFTMGRLMRWNGPADPPPEPNPTPSPWHLLGNGSAICRTCGATVQTFAPDFQPMALHERWHQLTK